MEPKKFQIFIVKEDSPAFQVIKKYFNQKRSIKSGKIIPVTEDEFRSFQEDFMYLEIDRGKSDNSKIKGKETQPKEDLVASLA